jgi:hypothetical protein
MSRSSWKEGTGSPATYVKLAALSLTYGKREMIHYWALTMAIHRFSVLFLVDLQRRQRTGSPQLWQTSSMSGFGWARWKARTCSSHEDVVSCGDRERAAGASLSIMQNLCLDFISNNSSMPARIVPTNYRMSEGQK